MFRFGYRAVLAILLFPLLQRIPTARAQEEYSRIEIGGQFSAIGLLNSSGGVGIWEGFGGRVDFNISRRLAYETQVDYFPQFVPTRFLEQGGQTLHFATGLRGKVLQSKRFSVYGVIRPGFIHFTDARLLAGAPGSTPGTKISPATYYALNLGGGMEFYFSPRWVARFELTGNPFLIPNARPGSNPSPGSPPVPTPGIIDDRYQLSAGLGYRLGALHENPKEESLPGKLEAGVQFTTLILKRRTTLDAIREEPGLGGFVSCPLMRFLYADASVEFYPRGSKTIGFQDGGRIVQGLFGVKGGISRKHISIFGKVRPGLIDATQTVNAFSSGTGSSATPVTGAFQTFALDLGGIVEIYASRRTLVRFDVGDTHLYFPDKFVTQTDGTVTRIPGGSYQHSMQYSAGYGWRF
jgi:hypothetical protein